MLSRLRARPTRSCPLPRREVQNVKREGLNFHAVLTEGGAERLELARV